MPIGEKGGCDTAPGRRNGQLLAAAAFAAAILPSRDSAVKMMFMSCLPRPASVGRGKGDVPSKTAGALVERSATLVEDAHRALTHPHTTLSDLRETITRGAGDSGRASRAQIVRRLFALALIQRAIHRRRHRVPSEPQLITAEMCNTVQHCNAL